MKENIKNQLLIFLLLIAMMLTIFTTVLIVSLDVFWLIKLVVVVLAIILTALIFIVMKNLNKKLVYIEKENTTVEEKIVKEPNRIKHICPKCYKPYDGEECFACGYVKNENNG